jgi:hypothetical protein
MVDFVLTLLGSRWSGAKAPHRCSGEGGLEKSDGQKAPHKKLGSRGTFFLHLTLGGEAAAG